MARRPDPTAADLLADLSDPLRRTYDALLFLGATAPSGGRTMDAIAEQVGEPRHELEYRLSVLADRGLVGHEKVGSDSVWYARS